MVTRSEKKIDADSPGKEKKIGEARPESGKDENCRCKEVSTMTPGQLLKTVISDLSFWKKIKK